MGRSTKVKPKREPAPAFARCVHCRELCGKDDYCYGCSAYVCARCDGGKNGEGEVPQGVHLPEAHLLTAGRQAS